MAAAALLLTGCGGDDDSGGSGAAGGFLSGGGSGSPEGDRGGDRVPPEPGEGDAGWYARWEGDGITVWTTADGVLYGNSATGDVCTQNEGIRGGLDWEPVLFQCEQAGLKNVRFERDGDTLSMEWSDRTEAVGAVESLADRTVDLDALRAGL